jgi:hypothetical protein
LSARADTPLRFEPRGLGREVALLGAVVVGELCELGGGGIGAWWRCELPDGRRAVIPARTVEAARRALIARVDDWLECARLAPTEVVR